MFIDRFKYFLIIGTILILLIATDTSSIYAQTNLIAEGKIYGYKTRNVRLFGTFARESDFVPVLFRVTKVLNGTEKSEFIKVMTHSFVEGYVTKTNELDTTFTFKLLRATKCDEKLSSLIEKQAEIHISFRFTSSMEKNSLPLEKKIPCYIGLYE